MSGIPTRTQVSAGGVAFREREGRAQVAIISVGVEERWQLPKGIVAGGETNEEAALREVREETGLSTLLLGQIERVEYWYVSNEGGRRVRFHKFVHFYLLRYLSGDVRDHDLEVNEARWVEIKRAVEMLAFASEKRVLERAGEMIEALNTGVE